MKNRLGARLSSRPSVSLSRLSFFLLIVSILSFCVVHLVVSSILDPRGKELRMLDNQKNQLIEENRVLEQEIAKLSSLSVVEGRAEKDLGMNEATKVVYINTPSASAKMDAVGE